MGAVVEPISDPLLKQWSDRVLTAQREKTPLQLRGGGSKDFYGQLIAGERFDTRAYSGIVSYEPTELVVTARCGTSLAELQVELATRKQMLAFEPPHFGAATVGGCVAAGLSGPRRRQAGAARDFVLGAKLLDGRGRLHEFGGQVMKNVAGYDVSRLLTGSLGTLGLITDVSLKVLPVPVAESTLQIACDESTALAQSNQWSSLPLPISASVWHDGALTLRLSGASAAVIAAQKKLGGDLLDEAFTENFWRDIREHRHAFFANDTKALWRLSVPSTTAALNVGNGLIEWNGSLRWVRSTLDAIELRRRVAAIGGSATLFRGGDKKVGVFDPLPAPLLRLHKNLKHEFDPAGIFNPGRMYAEF